MVQSYDCMLFYIGKVGMEVNVLKNELEECSVCISQSVYWFSYYVLQFRFQDSFIYLLKFLGFFCLNVIKSLN